MKLLHKASNQIIADNVIVAKSFTDRFFGLMGKKDLKLNHCLWIKRCNNIHTHFMRFPIDVVFLNKDLTIVAIKMAIKPWRFTLPVLKADSVIEFRAQSIANKLNIGDQIYVDT